MAEPQPTPTAAERAAATIAAAAEAADAEEAAEGEKDGGDESAALLATSLLATATGKPPLPESVSSVDKRSRAQRSGSPAVFMRPLAPPASGRGQQEGFAGGPSTTLGGAPSRGCQWLRCLPVLFVMFLVLYLNVVYVAYHCAPQLQLRVPPSQRDLSRFNKGSYELIAFCALTFLFLLSYWLAVTTPPGSIPKTPEWELRDGAPRRPPEAGPIETKKGGGRRSCKWCCQRKPDRAHHCRVCRSCVLKMDHHCPWIFNCVGWGNHKYFMLSLLWGAALALFVAITMLPSVKAAIKNEETSFERVFMLLFAETLDIFLCTLISGFLFFHSYLVTNAVTTIEFCEKQFKKTPFDAAPEVTWSRGFRKNFVDAFGPNPLLWFFPVDNRSGDGTSFVPSSPLYLDTENLEKRLSKTLSASRRYRGFDPVVDPES